MSGITHIVLRGGPLDGRKSVYYGGWLVKCPGDVYEATEVQGDILIYDWKEVAPKTHPQDPE